MRATFRSTRFNGANYQHLPESERPTVYTIDVIDDDGGAYLFHSDGQSVTARDWFDARIDGSRYCSSNAWHDAPVDFIQPDVPVFFAYGYDPDAAHVGRIVEIVQRVTSMPVQFIDGEEVTVTF